MWDFALPGPSEQGSTEPYWRVNSSSPDHTVRLAMSPMRVQMVMTAILLSGCGRVDPGDDRWSRPGDHASVVEESLGPDEQFTVFRPEDLSVDGPHPVVVWSVGTGASPGGYGALLRHWASHGLVVVAGDDGNQAVGDQALQALDWILGENLDSGRYPGQLDAGAVAASGHSQGGNACLHVALRDERVQTALPIQPGEGGLGFVDAAHDSQLEVPVFYICGEADTVVPPQRCADRFSDAKRRAWMGVVENATHFAVSATREGADNAEIRGYSTRWLKARLTGDRKAAEAFDGDDWGLVRDPDWINVHRSE